MSTADLTNVNLLLSDSVTKELSRRGLAQRNYLGEDHDRDTNSHSTVILRRRDVLMQNAIGV